MKPELGITFTEGATTLVVLVPIPDLSGVKIEPGDSIGITLGVQEARTMARAILAQTTTEGVCLRRPNDWAKQVEGFRSE